MILQKLLVLITGDNSDVTDSFRDTEREAQKSGAGISKAFAASAAGAAAAFAGVAAGVMASLDMEAANGKLQAQLGTTAAEAARLGKVSADLYKGAWGESVTDVNEALKSVGQNIGDTSKMSEAELKKVSIGVMDVATAFDQDLNGVTAAVGTLMKNGLAKDSTAALDLITKGMQNGANKADDLLDTLTEYPTVLARLGLDGAAATGLISQGLKAGARDSDTVADALKEFQIIATSGSESAYAGFEALGMDAEKMTAQIAAGGAGATAGLDLVLDGLRKMEDPVQRNAAAVALFGTKAEDLGSALFAMDPSSAAAGLGEVGGAAGKMGDALNDNAAAAIESFKRTALLGLTEFIGGKVIPKLHDLSGWWAEEGPGITKSAGAIAAGVMPVLSTLGIAVGVLADGIGTSVGFVVEHWDTFKWVFLGAAAIITPTLLVLAGQYAMAAVAATASAITQGLAWVGIGLKAMAGAATMGIAAARVVGSWVLMGAQAAIGAARTVGSLVLMGAGFVAQGAVAVASTAVTVATVVGGWVLMGAQSLLAAGKMAAAWLIAMGPIGLAIAAVVGIGYLIYRNWDLIVSKTKQAWSWVSDKVVGVAKWIYSAWQKYTPVGIIVSNWDKVMAFFTGIPDRIKGIFGGAKSWLLDAGKSIITGLVNGLMDMVPGLEKTLNWVTDKIPDWKGPAERDAFLLYDAGQSIMGSLVNGAEDAFGDVKRSLGGMTTELAVTGSAAAGAAPAPQMVAAHGFSGTVHITINDARDAGATARQVREELENLATGGRRTLRQGGRA